MPQTSFQYQLKFLMHFKGLPDQTACFIASTNGWLDAELGRCPVTQTVPIPLCNTVYLYGTATVPMVRTP